MDRLAKDFFLRRPEALDDPFADLAWLRENHPVHFDPELGQWFVFRHDDIAALYDDPRLTANRMAGFVDAAPEEVRGELAEIAPLFSAWLLMQDGAAHDRLRRALHAGFGLAEVKALRPAIEASARDLIAARLRDGRLDACADYAFLLPAYVLSDVLGVRPEDRDRVVAWSVDFVDFFNVVPITAETTRRMLRSTRELGAYTRALLEERRRAPQDDFLGRLVTGPEALDDEEIVSNAMLLLLAGHVAVRNLVGNLLWLLLRHPDQMARLRADRGGLRHAIEEALRYEPPVTMIPRVVAEGFEFRGCRLMPGQIVQLCLAAGNRDPGRFADPDRFDAARKPGRHLSFGLGAHACLGALLAREQAEVAVGLLLDQGEFGLDPDRPVTWYRNAGNRGPETLPLLFRASA